MCLLDYTSHLLGSFHVNFQMAVDFPVGLVFMRPFILHKLLSHCSGSGKIIINFEFSMCRSTSNETSVKSQKLPAFGETNTGVSCGTG